jgi:hypothetical protein
MHFPFQATVHKSQPQPPGSQFNAGGLSNTTTKYTLILNHPRQAKHYPNCISGTTSFEYISPDSQPLHQQKLIRKGYSAISEISIPILEGLLFSSSSRQRSRSSNVLAPVASTIQSTTSAALGVDPNHHRSRDSERPRSPRRRHRASIKFAKKKGRKKLNCRRDRS